MNRYLGKYKHGCRGGGVSTKLGNTFWSKIETEWKTLKLLTSFWRVCVQITLLNINRRSGSEQVPGSTYLPSFPTLSFLRFSNCFQHQRNSYYLSNAPEKDTFAWVCIERWYQWIFFLANPVILIFIELHRMHFSW